VFAAPLLTIAANPQSILNSPAVDMIKSIPPVWDETIVLPSSEIGELAVYVRRKGDTWFLAVMCGPQAKTVKVPLSFLGDGKYKASLVRDDPKNPAAMAAESTTQTHHDSLTLDLQAGGGFIERFEKIK
jgi:alpha-glucosidase